MNAISPLRAFRMERQLTLGDVAERLGVHKTTLSRIETGELPADADMVERIFSFTEGAVDAASIHAVRLAWLKENRPDRFAQPAEAAE